MGEKKQGVSSSFLQISNNDLSNTLSNRINDLNANLSISTIGNSVSLTIANFNGNIVDKDLLLLQNKNPALENVVELIKEMISNLANEANDKHSHSEKCKIQIDMSTTRL